MSTRVALVTGASSGIGRATVVELCRRGVQVMAVARREPLLQELARETGASYVACSLATVAGCTRAVEETHERLGPIEILVNNAALGSGKDGSVLELDLESWRATMGLNLDTPFILTSLAAVDMIQRGWGRVVMVSSTAGLAGGAKMAAYCASKHGLLGLMRATSIDLAASGITCNAVAPGWVRTELTERSAAETARERGTTADEVWAERAASYPAGRVVSEVEVAHAIAFLASEESSGINGQVVTVALGGLW